MPQDPKLSKGTSFSGAGSDKLRKLGVSLGFDSQEVERAGQMLSEVLSPWGDQHIGAIPLWPSKISDDSSPYEFSVVLSPRPEVRLLWDNEGSARAPAYAVPTALDAHRTLCRRLGANQERFDQIRDLFAPDMPEESFVLWHAIRLLPFEATPELKVYFNAQIRGRLMAPALVEAALDRLGFPGAYARLMKAMQRGPELDEIRYLALDLCGGEAARVKVYVFHHQPTPAVISEAASAAPSADATGIAAFFEGLSEGRAPSGGFAPATCLSFVAGRDDPSAATLHFPVRGYVRNDEEVSDRLRAVVDGSIVARHEASVEAVRQRPLSDGVGLSAYVSMRSDAHGARYTEYLSTETFAVTPPGPPAPAASPPPLPVERLVEDYEAQPLSQHPFFSRMAREPVVLANMWTMFHNIYEGLSQHFPRRLAHVIARVEHESIRSVLAAQLHEELGCGDPARTHRKLFVQLLENLAPWKPEPAHPAMDTPGRNLGPRLEAVYYDESPYVGVGAAIVIELLGKHVDVFVAGQFRRQEAVSLATLEWLTAHEELEIEHADESMQLAGYLTTDAQRRDAWRGGQATFAAGWAFFDDMYRLCYA